MPFWDNCTASSLNSINFKKLNCCWILWLDPFRAHLWNYCLFSGLMESQYLRKGNARSFGLGFCHCSEGLGFSHQPSFGSLSFSLNAISAVPEYCNPSHWVTNLLKETQYSFQYEDCAVSYFSWRGDESTLTFLPSTDISIVPSDTHLQYQEEGTEFFADRAMTRRAYSSPNMLHIVGPLITPRGSEKKSSSDFKRTHKRGPHRLHEPCSCLETHGNTPVRKLWKVLFHYGTEGIY